MSVDYISRVLHEYIDSNFTDVVDYLRCDKEGWLDSVDFYLSRNRGSYNTPYHPPSGNGRAAHVYNRLCHIVVNPNNKYNTRALINSYVFGSVTETDNNAWVNYSEESSKAFVTSLIELSIKQRELLYGDHIDASGQALVSQPLVMLHGQRGSGKTFFLNYLLSKFSPLLDSKKVIWVRLNLADDFGKNDNLLHRIYAQITKIIFRYYDPESIFTDIANSKPIQLYAAAHLESFIENLKGNSKTKNHLDLKLIGMRQVLHAMRPDEAIYPELIPIELAREATSYAGSMGYSFIVVLDGLDQLESTPSAQEKFSQIIADTTRITQSNTRLGLSFVMVSRTTTYEYLAGWDPFKSREHNEYSVLPVPIDIIVNKRLNYIQQEVEGIAE